MGREQVALVGLQHSRAPVNREFYFSFNDESPFFTRATAIRCARRFCPGGVAFEKDLQRQTVQVFPNLKQGNASRAHF